MIVDHDDCNVALDTNDDDGILTMMNPPTQGTNLADLAMKAASAAATNHSA